ncbi:MAG TPA: PAS domain-containing protein, partial [Candidatus Limnocylindrales bacterium]|nr:PAS domain-containing protein [Candidatus Limnocylindrales bacterium]
MPGHLGSPRLITIPSADTPFRAHVERVRHRLAPARPDQLESGLRRLFPRVVVRERALSGEAPVWYVYRDGGWRPSLTGPWWEVPGLPRIVISADGWVEEASGSAADLLGIEASEVGARHITDFVAPGTLDDAMALLAVIEEGHDLTATVLLRPSTGDIVAVDLHATRSDSRISAALRLSEDMPVSVSVGPIDRPEVACRPATDAAFAGYVALALTRMSEPTPDGLALRLHRLYPHARVELDGTGWIAWRDREDADPVAAEWWRDARLPTVRYDAQALILEANDAAQELLGSPLIGHYWQEFVTPGTTEQVSSMLAILASVG